MIELLETFSVYQIIVYTIMLSLTIKGCIDFCSWCSEQYKIKFDKDYIKKKNNELLEKHYRECEYKHGESVKQYQQLNQKLDKIAADIDEKVGKLEDQVTQLIDSDRNDIKSWIVEKHHKYVEQKWIDDFTMDAIEHRFANYKAENGNSYIGNLMTELRALPHTPPETD